MSSEQGGVTTPGGGMTALRHTTTRDQHRATMRRGRPPCGICGDAIDYDLKTPDLGSFEVDHIVPLALGGADDLANKQAAHRRCNRDKWHRVAEAEPTTWVTSRCWW